jgi:hypothetical protein
MIAVSLFFLFEGLEGRLQRAVRRALGLEPHAECSDSANFGVKSAASERD